MAQSRLTGRFGFSIAEADFKVSNCSEFLKRCGYGYEETQSQQLKDYIHVLKPYLDEIPESCLIIEIGFDAGTVSEFFLQEKPQCRVISFDLGLNNYTGYAKLYLDRKFSGRHQLILGDPNQSVDTLIEMFKDSEVPNLADLIFVNYQPISKLIRTLAQLADSNTRLFFNNLVPHLPLGVGVYQEYQELIKQELIRHEAVIEINSYQYGIGLAHFIGSKEGPLPLTKKEKEHIERYVPVYRAIQRLNDSEDITELYQVYKETVEIAGDHPEYERMYQQMLKLFNGVKR